MARAVVAQPRPPVGAEHPAGGGGEPAAAGDGPHRRLPVPPHRPGDALGRDLAGHGRAGHAGEDPLRRVEQLRRVAHRAGQRGGAQARFARPGQRAVLLQPRAAHRRDGRDPGGAGVRSRRDPVVAAEPGAAGRRLAQGARRRGVAYVDGAVGRRAGGSGDAREGPGVRGAVRRPRAGAGRGRAGVAAHPARGDRSDRRPAHRGTPGVGAARPGPGPGRGAAGGAGRDLPGSGSLARGLRLVRAPVRTADTAAGADIRGRRGAASP
ncbi:hypothetical protein SBRY_50804 [Actinacidiphila bryophytorum]|uniref:Uncharacterized protein n=1 Tax=Actinacidiphila bryophytorum TaxID=1436133 RepID=A0A9W4H4Z5_9ACTN|nr:hypothetical protein SBRY_50804 [Actinacidiphila bryophytorum]